MTVSLLFWIVMLLWLILGVGANWKKPTMGSAPSILLFLAVFLLGWAVFGWPIKGGA